MSEIPSISEGAAGIDMLPPNSYDAERGVLSCAMQAPVEVMPDIAFRLTSDSFYDLRCRIVWDCLRAKHDKGQNIDVVTVMMALKDGGTLDQIGGIEWLNGVQDFAPSPAGLMPFVVQVKEKHALRRLVKGCSSVVSDVMAGKSLDEIRSESESLFDIEPTNETPALDGKQSAEAMIDDLQRRFELKGALSGLDTGFHRLNNKTEGLQYGEQTLIGARPSMGKTALGLCIFQHAVFKNNEPSLFVSLEMSTASLMRRMLSSYSEIPMGDIKRGSYSEDHFQKFMSFRAAASKAPMHILDGVCGLSIGEICYRVRSLCKKHGIKLVVIDYLQKIQPGSRHEKRTYEVAEVSGKLKALAVETGAAFLTLAQLNRESEKDKGRPPRLADLADSGQIERDADTVALIHRDRAQALGDAMLIIAKQRDGEVGAINLRFNGNFCRFENAQVVEHNEPQDQENP